MLSLEDHALGVSSDMRTKPGLGKALKILRLMHLKELRSLQDDINDTIESVQALTANPKTDTRLGKVGRWKKRKGRENLNKNSTLLFVFRY